MILAAITDARQYDDSFGYAIGIIYFGIVYWKVPAFLRWQDERNSIFSVDRTFTVLWVRFLSVVCGIACLLFALTHLPRSRDGDVNSVAPEPRFSTKRTPR